MEYQDKKRTPEEAITDILSILSKDGETLMMMQILGQIGKAVKDNPDKQKEIVKEMMQPESDFMQFLKNAEGSDFKNYYKEIIEENGQQG